MRGVSDSGMNRRRRLHVQFTHGKESRRMSQFNCPEKPEWLLVEAEAQSSSALRTSIPTLGRPRSHHEVRFLRVELVADLKIERSGLHPGESLSQIGLVILREDSAGRVRVTTEEPKLPAVRGE